MDGCQAAGQFALALAGASQHAQPDNQLEPELHPIQPVPPGSTDQPDLPPP
jgi:hypothetical protein